MKYLNHNLSRYGRLSLQGIHLKNPTYAEFEDALNIAKRDNFEHIHVYNTKPIFKKYFKILTETKLFKEQDIISFRSILSGFCRTSLNEDERAILLHIFEDLGPYKITEDQTKKGKNWLYNYCFKKNGQPREDKNSWVFQYHLETIKNIDRFEFIDLMNIGTYRPQYIPVYRTYATDGSYFDYTPGCQGTPEVV